MNWREKVFKLSNGVSMPAIGLGTYKIKGQEVTDQTLGSALKEGYGLIDTASVYRNEAFIASTLRSNGVNRKDVFITSKLGPKDHGQEKVAAAITKSLTNLDTDYLDLYLIHWPGVQGVAVDDPQNKELRKQSWKVLEDFYDKGVLKSIGVSNYNIDHLQELLDECRIKPHVNQVEIHPHYTQRDLIKFCNQFDIHVTAYSSLGTTTPSNGDTNELLKDPVVTKISQAKNLSNAQVLLLWALQKGVSVVPKSTNPQHIAENINLDNSSLTDQEIELLDTIDFNKKYAWNADKVL